MSVSISTGSGSRDDLQPRLCVLEKGSNGYGFHLHGEKGKAGQFIRLVEPESPAEASGLRAGDRLVFVNGDCVESDSHQHVVSRIRATVGQLELIVVDQETDELLQSRGIKCLKEFVTEGIPPPSGESAPDVERESPRDPSPVPEENGGIPLEKDFSVGSDKENRSELRPRLCIIRKGACGYGFNLHSERSKPGQYIRAVDEDSPAQRAGLLPKDRIVQVNGESVEGKQHAEVVATIKAGGEETALLVVDPDTDAFFRKCQVSPTKEHITGPLPEPITNGSEEKINGDVSKEGETKEIEVSVSPALSNASSDASFSAPAPKTPPPELVDELPGVGALSLTMSLQQAKERAHQKRSNKRAPAMDWSKKNELFSNL
ncbi:Na(+)/H(+) exchange regulatory cofactor NHE-RF1-like [Scleropages formosus]|uniref:Na(+)/H(+) exchange regulatory cofactor NHE-RF n=1 Tax=Scleropages formosus TaxID=113540 RepID=A0A0P7V7N8_SCLFO|nr:Na(+)/H(+) exchange regulatory cofactor NHE-RF1-like [Scleropages formosus]KPP78198.1 Na(+)/H(+) exchange regulatory cofactor NHE-RF1-like [Scleropages formosus]